jgi:hypothetical protein
MSSIEKFVSHNASSPPAPPRNSACVVCSRRVFMSCTLRSAFVICPLLSLRAQKLSLYKTRSVALVMSTEQTVPVLRLSQWCSWGIRSYGMWRLVTGRLVPGGSRQRCWFIVSVHVLVELWRRDHYAVSKRRKSPSYAAQHASRTMEQ